MLVTRLIKKEQNKCRIKENSWNCLVYMKLLLERNENEATVVGEKFPRDSGPGPNVSMRKRYHARIHTQCSPAGVRGWGSEGEDIGGWGESPKI